MSSFKLGLDLVEGRHEEDPQCSCLDEAHEVIAVARQEIGEVYERFRLAHPRQLLPVLGCLTGDDHRKGLKAETAHPLELCTHKISAKRKVLTHTWREMSRVSDLKLDLRSCRVENRFRWMSYSWRTCVAVGSPRSRRKAS